MSDAEHCHQADSKRAAQIIGLATKAGDPTPVKSFQVPPLKCRTRVVREAFTVTQQGLPVQCCVRKGIISCGVCRIVAATFAVITHALDVLSAGHVRFGGQVTAIGCSPCMLSSAASATEIDAWGCPSSAEYCTLIPRASRSSRKCRVADRNSAIRACDSRHRWLLRELRP